MCVCVCPRICGLLVQAAELSEMRKISGTGVTVGRYRNRNKKEGTGIRVRSVE